MARKTSFEQQGSQVPSGFKMPEASAFDRLVNWVKENFSSVILPVLAIIVLGAGIYYYSTGTTPSQRETANLAATASESTTTTSKTDPRPAPATPPTPTVEPPVSPDSDSALTETAAKGEGVTHLARRALKTFLATHQDPTLTSEHKIYIEDFLKDQAGSRPLAVGETVQFSTKNIVDAIAKAQQLTPRQLQNLTQYAQRVLVL